MELIKRMTYEKAKELNKWIEVKDGFKLPSAINPDHFIKLYIWNTSKEEDGTKLRDWDKSVISKVSFFAGIDLASRDL